MRIVNITNLKACTVAVQTTRTQSTQTAFMSKLSKRVNLVHKLRQLARTEELFDRANNRLNRNQILRLNRLGFFHAHTLFCNTLHTRKSTLELICQKLANRANATITKVVDVVSSFNTDVHLNEILHRLDNIRFFERERFQRLWIGKFFVELIATNAPQIVAANAKEHTLQIFCRCFNRNRLARLQNRVNRSQRIFSGRLFRFRTFFYIANFLTLKTVDNHFTVKRTAFLKINYIDFFDFVRNQIINNVRMQFCTSGEQFFLFPVLIDKHSLCKHFVKKQFAAFSTIRNRDILGFVETRNNLFARTIA